MNAAGIHRLQGLYAPDIVDADDLASVGAAGAADAAALGTRQDTDFMATVMAAERDPVLVMAQRLLGKELTADNLAWRGDPVPLMRSLQKMLVAHSLTLPEDRRAPAMGAIQAVEQAVRWRLRWMQMRRSEAESHFIPPQQDDHAT